MTRPLSVIMQVAMSNCFPALGMDVWTASRHTLPAGFITIRGRDHNRVNAIADALVRELDGGTKVTGAWH
jgi:hypothetical protein